MSSLTDRLRGVLGPAARRHVETDDEAGERRPSGDDAGELLGGQWHDAGSHRFLVVDRKYSPGHRHGRAVLADYLPPDDGIWPRLPLLLTNPSGMARHEAAPCETPARQASRVLFLDLETTGLAGGAGTYAFLIGCGWFDGGVFRVRQLFLSSYAAERGLLDALTELAAPAAAIVTYNGKSFDVPLIETRFVMHRMQTPFAGAQHVDMLHAARRMWREDEEDEAAGTASGCRLSAVEGTLCGYVREGDVPGFEIPSRYFHYVRTGDARPLDAVLEHNRLDLLSLALVTAHAAQLLESGPSAARTAREALGLGRLYERGGHLVDARACYAHAAGIEGESGRRLPGSAEIRAHALRAYAVLCRRGRAYQDAAAAWRRIIEMKRSPPHLVREAMEALAVHHEHRLRDPRAARTFAARSLQLSTTTSRTQALHHRLARLDRKLTEPAMGVLF